MQDALLMAVDLGTSFIKVGVYNTKSECLTVADEPVKERCPKPGIYIQDGEEILASVLNCIKKASDALGSDAGKIEAICFTGQMAGFMGIDKDWNDITTWSCSLDGRYLPYAETMMKQYADLFLEEAGTNCPVMAPKVEWFRRDFPDESKKIVKYMMIGGYVLGKMGEIDIEEATINRSYLEWTGLSDIRHDRWSAKILGNLNISESNLPKIVDANTICGKLAPSVAARCGLKSGIPLVAGCGDKPAGCLGAAAVEFGDTVLEAASYAGMSCCIKEYRPDLVSRRLDVVPSAIPGEFYLHNFIAGSGITLDWFLDNFRGEAQGIGEAFKEMDAKIAGLEPGADGVFAIGMLGGRAMPLDGNVRGTWMNFNWGHRREHFYRALIESYSYEFANTLQRIDEMYPEYTVDNVRIIGGGAKSEVWNQINADVSRRDYVTLNRKDAALWGTAIIAGNAAGIFSDMKQTAKQFVKAEKRYSPNAERAARYQKYRDVYNKYIVDFHKYFVELQQI